MSDINNTSTPEQKRQIELAYLNREIEALAEIPPSIMSDGDKGRLKTLHHQRDVTLASAGSHAPQAAGTPEPENPPPLEAVEPPFPGAQGAPHEIEIEPDGSAGGAPPFPAAAEAAPEATTWDVNWLIHQFMAGIANIDTSGRVVAEASMRTARATERLATMAEARELRIRFVDGPVPPAGIERSVAAYTARMASLLSVPDQVAATDHAVGAGEGGEAASLGESPPVSLSPLPMLERIRHILREWTWEGKHHAVERVVFALSGGDTIWEGEETARLAGHAAKRTEAQTDGG